MVNYKLSLENLLSSKVLPFFSPQAKQPAALFELQLQSGHLLTRGLAGTLMWQGHRGVHLEALAERSPILPTQILPFLERGARLRFCKENAS